MTLDDSLAAAAAGRRIDGRVALEELYRDALRRFCYGYLRDAAAAEDAVQDVFCKVLAAGAVPDDFRAWLYRTARNHCLNLVRAKGRRREGADRLSELALVGAAAGPLSGLLAQERREQVAGALAAIPERTARSCCALREGLSREEIARCSSFRGDREVPPPRGARELRGCCA